MSSRNSPRSRASGPDGSAVESPAGDAVAAARRERRGVLLVVLVALCVRLAVLWLARDAEPWNDQITYVQRAEDLLDGKGYTGSYQSWVQNPGERQLHTLERAGFVERVGDSATYRLGLGVLRLGFEYLASMELTEIGHPVITRLRDRTGCSAHLVVRDGREVVFVAKAPGASALFQSVQVGARLPAHATVLGRLLHKH